MEILTRANYQELLVYIPHITSSLRDWKLVDIRLTGDSEKYFTISRLADLLHSLFKDKEGKIYTCNDREIFALIRWGQHNDPLLLSRKIEERLSAISYEIIVHDPTPEGLQKLEMLIRYEETGTCSFGDTRHMRRENVLLVADRDPYMRMLIKKGIPEQVTVHQVTEGNAVMEAYKKYVPDIMFLDLNLQGRNGMELMQEIISVDPEAYIIMMNNENPLELAKQVTRAGASGLIAKPLSQGKLMEYMKRCKTLS